MFSFKKSRLNWENINIIQNIKKNFSYYIFMKLLKIILKIFIVFLVCFLCFLYFFLKIINLFIEFPIISFQNGYNIIILFLIIILFSFIPIIAFDIFLQKLNYYKKLKMSHQEILDENKEIEGNLNIKIRIQKEMRKYLNKCIIINLPKSDVIITDANNIAVAIKYDIKTMNAPKILAKGIGQLANRIIKITSNHNILVLSIPILANLLYKYGHVDQYIPNSLYISVAEVLAWVWKVRKWKKEGGIFPEKPTKISLPPKFDAL